MIAIRNLQKRYGQNLALDDLSFTVEKGEICGLLGPNGAGKSTTMNIVTGYISASAGTVEIDGCDIFEKPREARAKIGYLPEQPPVYMDMTPREYLLFVAELKGHKRAERAALVDEAIEKTGLAEVQERLIRNLSKGYKQRVGLAQAILGGPEVIILDEPTVGLDPKQIIEIRSLIKSLAKEHTVLLSSHIMQEISAVCDKVVIIDKGRLVAYDTPQNLSAAEVRGALLVTALGGEDTVRKALEGVPGAGEIAFVPCSEAGAVQARVSTKAGDDLRAAVSTALSAAGCPVLSLQLETRSLEDVFLDLTSEAEAQDAAPAAEAAADAAQDTAQKDADEKDAAGEAADAGDGAGAGADAASAKTAAADTADADEKPDAPAAIAQAMADAAAGTAADAARTAQDAVPDKTEKEADDHDGHL